MKKILLVLLLVPSFIFSQELRAKVNVNYEQLPNAAKERLIDFQSAVEDYLNNTKFTNLNWDGDPITCSFNIFFTASQGETQYSAQVVVNSQRPIYQSTKSSLMLNIMDKEWSFEYEKNQAIRFNLVDFDPLTSFLDFYAYLIIGFDMDSYNPLGGTDYFNKAYDITVLGGNNKYSAGWQLKSTSYNKRKLLQELLDAKFNQFRKDYFNYHYNGLDLFHEDKKVAQKNIAKLINHLYENIDSIGRNSVLIKVFFDAKSNEIVNYLEGYEPVSIFEELIKVNPENINKYEKALEEE